MVNKINVLLLIIIAALIVMSAQRVYYSSSGNTFNAGVSLSQHASTGSDSILASQQQVSTNITSNELINANNSTNTNFLFNEKFIPGQITTSSGVLGCYAGNYVTYPHVIWNCIPAPVPLFGCIPLLSYESSTTYTNTTYNNLVGYLGFPTSDSSIQTEKCPAAHPNLFSAVTAFNNPSSITYCLPTQTANITENGYNFTNKYSQYPNFINWSVSTIHSYSGTSQSGQTYYYAINDSMYIPSFEQYSSSPALPEGSTLIIPSISCGATFLNNYLSYLSTSSAQGIPAILSLSGFTPSVGLASGNSRGMRAIYYFGDSLWPSLTSSLIASQIQALPASFEYTLPKAMDYAKFPAGNKGDLQYLNVSSFFNTPLITGYFYPGTSSSIAIYVSNTSISSINTSSLGSAYSNLTGCCVTGLSKESAYAASQTTVSKYSQILQDAVYGYIPSNTYTLPNLQGVYYPGLTTAPQSTFITYDFFKADGVFPFCNWSSSLNNVLPSCTFENESSINPISYYRLWQSNFKNKLNIQPFSPMQNGTSQLNNFTIGAMDSFCFYGESFNTATGVYTSPSFTRIIPPTSQENYTSAVGECNAFFNNTNCFSADYSSYLNFNDGIFMRNISCTPNGINASSVEDAWIKSLYVANNGGNFCGDFMGQKDTSNPTANSTMFLYNTSSCPTFNSNSSTASLVVTVKNVGNTNITNPYVVVLYGGGVNNMFYSANNNAISNYNLYSEFITQMESQTNGIISLTYNNALSSDMYVYYPGNLLNPVPIQNLFSSGSNNYVAGPFNNSLLGMWMYAPDLSTNSINTNVIRTSNTFLSHSDSGNATVPVISPGGTATFTIQVPVTVLESLLSGKYNVSVYFGNIFNVSWGASGNGPSNQIGSMSVTPLVSSGDTNNSQTHNNEFIDPSSSNPSPLYQYMVSYKVNMSKKPFSGISVYADSLNISFSNQSAQNSLTVGLNPSVRVVNGSGSYTLGLSDLTGSSVSCFASQDNINDFSVFWSTQQTSPFNLKYAVSDFYTTNSQINNVLVNRWRGLLFMPYEDAVALNYDNLPVYPISSVSMQIQKPTLNETSGSSAQEAFVYFEAGNRPQLNKELSSAYNLLSSTPSVSLGTVPPSTYGASIFTATLLSDNSVLKIIGTQTLLNSSVFSDKSVSLSLVKNGAQVSGCSNIQETTNGSGVAIISASSCISSSAVKNENLQISSSYGPFYVEAYNSSVVNMSNPVSQGVFLIASNISSSSVGGVYTTYLNLSSDVSNGLTLVFGLPPKTKILTGSNLYLYYANDTPFSCNIVDTLNSQPHNLSSASEISTGYYSTPNGTILCKIGQPFTGIRAVFVNASKGKANGQYLISGDIGLGVSIQNMGGQEWMITNNGVPINSQNLSLYSVSASATTEIQTNCLSDVVVTNGILNYSSSSCKIQKGGNYLLSFTDTSGGQTSLTKVPLLNLSTASIGDFLLMSPSSVSDTPSGAYSINLSNTAQSVPVTFSLGSQGGTCDSIRVLGDAPYPYSEIPYQVTDSSGGGCTYTIVYNESQAFSGNSYIVFAGENPSPLTYPDNWINVSASPYSISLSTKEYNTTLLGNCKASVGPCLQGFHLTDGTDIGNLLVNNVSASSASVSEISSGPVAACFLVSYSASQQVVWNENNFGSITYNANNLYQLTNPQEAISSTYCLYKDSSVITDSINSTGSPLSFNIEDNLVSNFSYTELSNGKLFQVPPSKFVGYSSFSNIYVGKQQLSTLNYSAVNLNMSCIPNLYANISLQNASGTTLSFSSYNSSGDYNKVYCMFGGRPTYTSESGAPSNGYTTPGGESVSLLYRPGIYNLSTSSATGGVNNTLYADCALTKNITSTSGIQTLPNGDKLYILTWPRLYVNGSWINYNPTNLGERYLANYTALLNDPLNNPGGVLYGTSGISLIDSCPANYTISSMTYCSKPVPTVLSAGSYTSIEGIQGVLGGGCYIGSIGGSSFSCMPTDGKLSFEGLPASNSSTSGSVGYTVTYYNSSSSPVTSLAESFTCTGLVYVNSTSKSILSCGNGGSSTYCSSSITTGSAGTNKSYVTLGCKVNDASAVNSSITINVKSISASQSDPTQYNATTGLCFNSSDLIASNVNNGIASWKHYNKSVTNPITGNTNSLPEVGGCEVARDTINITSPVTNQTSSASSYTETYSCPSGYTGSIESCVAAPKTLFLANINSNPSCYNTNYTEITSYTSYTQESGNSSNGAIPTGCNSFSQTGYTQPTLANGCVASHVGISNSTEASYALQYSNKSGSPGFGVGLGVFNATLPTNVSIPSSGATTKTKDQYMTGLSVSQKEFTNMITHLYPSNLLLSSLGSTALEKSSMYPFDMLSILMLQNQYFGISGIPGLANGSVYDYAMSLFTGGTSANCIPGSPDYSLFSLGEGELCSGQNLPPVYSNGIYLPVGILNEGLHSIQFYSVSENGGTSAPNVNVLGTSGTAYNLNSACSDGNQRVFTSTYTGGKWEVSLTSDENCNSINNHLYGYIVNCMYQTPGNLTYSTSSKYYLSYDLPTLWNVSYTLLVSPKTYNIVPVPVYQVGSNYGSYLSLYDFVTTSFVENNLPTGRQWTVTYANHTKSSTDNSVSFLLQVGNYSFSVKTLSNSSTNPDCVSTYTPNPSSGVLLAGNTKQITFVPHTSCITTFAENGLQNGLGWNVSFTSKPIVNVSTAPSTVTFVTGPGSYGFTVPVIKTPSIEYEPYPSFGTANAGSTVLISFRSIHIGTTTFTETGLPVYGSGSSAYVPKWTVNFDSVNGSSTSNLITFNISGNSLSYRVYDVYVSKSSSDCVTTYTPSPSSGNVNAGSSVGVSFTGSTSCTTTFTETGLPSGTKWTVNYLSTKDSTSNKITFTSGVTTHSFSVNSLKLTSGNCVTYYSPTPSSGSLPAGQTKSISFSGSTTCTTTFKNSDLNSGYSWSVTNTNTGSSSSGGTGSDLTLTSGSGTLYYNAQITNSGIDCYASGNTQAGSTVTPIFTCLTTFNVTSYHSQDSGATWKVTWNGTQKSQSSPSYDIIFTTTSSQSTKVPFNASFSVSDIGTLTQYPHPGSGTLISGGTQGIWYGFS